MIRSVRLPTTNDNESMGSHPVNVRDVVTEEGNRLARGTGTTDGGWGHRVEQREQASYRSLSWPVLSRPRRKERGWPALLSLDHAWEGA